MSRPRVILVALFILVVVIPMAVYAAKYDPEVALSPAQAVALYRAETASLTVPPGWEWTAPYFPSDRTFHESRAVDPQLPAAERQQALDQVLSIRTKYSYTSAPAEEQASWDRMLENAASGNMDELRGYYEVHCPKNQ